MERNSDLFPEHRLIIELKITVKQYFSLFCFSTLSALLALVCGLGGSFYSSSVVCGSWLLVYVCGCEECMTCLEKIKQI